MVVMSFCVAGAALCDIPTCLITCRKSFCVAGAILFASFSPDELQFSWQAQHFGHLCRHFEWQAQHSRLHTPHSTLHPLHFTLRTLHSTLYTLHSTLYTLHPTLYTALFTLHYTLHTLHSTLYDSTLYNLHFTPYTLHSTLHTRHCTLQTRDETRGSIKTGISCETSSNFTLCSFKIDVFLRVFLGTSKFATSKSMFRGRLHISQNATPATPCCHSTCTVVWYNVV